MRLKEYGGTHDNPLVWWPPTVPVSIHGADDIQRELNEAD